MSSLIHYNISFFTICGCYLVKLTKIRYNFVRRWLFKMFKNVYIVLSHGQYVWASCWIKRTCSGSILLVHKKCGMRRWDKRQLTQTEALFWTIGTGTTIHHNNPNKILDTRTSVRLSVPCPFSRSRYPPWILQPTFVSLKEAPKQTLCSLLTSDMLDNVSNSIIKTSCTVSEREAIKKKRIS